MRYSYVLRFPDNAPPFDRDLESRWRSFLGEFVRPIADKFPDLLFWCSYYYSVAKFRVLSESQEVHDFITTRISDLKLGFNLEEEVNETLIGDLGNDRFVNQIRDEVAKQKRAELTLRFLCATVRLHIDSLVPCEGQYWEHQPTPHAKENPHGNNFESLSHLVGNISRFEFDLIDGNRTVWQFQQQPGNTRLAIWR